MDHWKSDGGGGEKKKKKIHARENIKKKNSSKEEGEEKRIMQKEGPIMTILTECSQLPDYVVLSQERRVLLSFILILFLVNCSLTSF